MKKCPQCGREYDLSMSFCLDDGAELLYGPAAAVEPATAILSEPGAVATGFRDGDVTLPQVHTTVTDAEHEGSSRHSPEKRSLSANRAAKPLAVLGIAVLLLIGGFLSYRYFAPANSGQIESIAVMPFVNESGSQENEYLSDGMTETLIGSLSQLPNLNVKPRSSVFRYKGKETDPQTIAKELDVQAVLNGRVVQRGQDVSLFVELVDTGLNKVVWSQQYNRKQSDLVSLQSEIAREVSNKIRTKLSGTDEAKVTKNYTANPEAYQLYLKGRFLWNQRTPESIRQAVEFFDQAIEKDPGYALAYSGLAESYVLFSNYEIAAPKDSMPKAKAAALRAIELDDSLAESHTALGMYYSWFAWDQEAAEREFRRAIELNPNYASAYQQLGVESLTAMRRFDEAIAAGKRAEEIDPLSPLIAADLGNILTRARRLDEGIAQLQKVVSQNPNFAVGLSNLGNAYHAKGNFEEAIAAYRKALAIGERPFVKGLLVRSLVRSGQRDEAVKLLAEIEARSAGTYVTGAALALAYGALGDKDKAFAMLEREIAERGVRPPMFAVHPIWDDLRDDPRFDAIVRKVEQTKLN